MDAITIITGMKYAIIAAGEGLRLAEEGISRPKPLVKINGEYLIERLLRIFLDNGATEILVICNGLTNLVSEYLMEVQRNGLKGRTVPLRFVIKTTPSSMHSFYELSGYITGNEPFVLTTVDTVFREEEFTEYVEALRSAVEKKYDGLMGVTDYVDDEKPLYVGTDEAMDIIGFYDEDRGCQYISGGIYGLLPKALDTLERCVENGESRMRNYQRALIRDGNKLKAYRFSKVLDIDHASDIAKAEDFLKAGKAVTE